MNDLKGHIPPGWAWRLLEIASTTAEAVPFAALAVIGTSKFAEWNTCLALAIGAPTVVGFARLQIATLGSAFAPSAGNTFEIVSEVGAECVIVTTTGRIDA
jgi:hypothetical protein